MHPMQGTLNLPGDAECAMCWEQLAGEPAAACYTCEVALCGACCLSKVGPPSPTDLLGLAPAGAQPAAGSKESSANAAAKA